jgi:hypothetical protein
MADINIERKGASIWPWVVGLVILAIVVFVVLQYFKGRNAPLVAPPPDSTTVQQVQPPPPPATPDSLAGDSTRNDSVPGTTTTAQ